MSSESDIDDAFAVVRACELADIGWSDATRESVRAHLSGPLGWRREASRCLPVDGGPWPSSPWSWTARRREVFLDAFAVGGAGADPPACPPRARAWPRTRELADADAGSGDRRRSGPVRAVRRTSGRCSRPGYEQDAGYREVLQDIGLSADPAVLAGCCSTCPERPPDEPAPPAGVTRRVVDGEADRRLLHALFAGVLRRALRHDARRAGRGLDRETRGRAGRRSAALVDRRARRAAGRPVHPGRLEGGVRRRATCGTLGCPAGGARTRNRPMAAGVRRSRFRRPGPYGPGARRRRREHDRRDGAVRVGGLSRPGR